MWFTDKRIMVWYLIAYVGPFNCLQLTHLLLNFLSTSFIPSLQSFDCVANLPIKCVIATVAVIFMTLSRPEYDGPVNFEELTPFNFHSRVVNETDKRFVARQLIANFLSAPHWWKGNVASAVLRKLEQWEPELYARLCRFRAQVFNFFRSLSLLGYSMLCRIVTMKGILIVSPKHIPYLLISNRDACPTQIQHSVLQIWTGKRDAHVFSRRIQHRRICE